MTTVGGGGGIEGRLVLLGIFGGGVRLGSPNPDPISDLFPRIQIFFQPFTSKWLKSIPYFRPKTAQKPYIAWPMGEGLGGGTMTVPRRRRNESGSVCFTLKTA